MPILTEEQRSSLGEALSSDLSKKVKAAAGTYEPHAGQEGRRVSGVAMSRVFTEEQRAALQTEAGLLDPSQAVIRGLPEAAQRLSKMWAHKAKTGKYSREEAISNAKMVFRAMSVVMGDLNQPKAAKTLTGLSIKT